MTLKSYSFQTTHPDTNAVIQLDFEAWQGAGASFVRQADLTSFNIRDLSGRQINFDTMSLDAQTTLGNAARNFTAYKSLVDELGIRPEQFIDYLGERYPGGAGNTVSTGPSAQTLENFFDSFGINAAERVVKGGFQPISAAATVIEGIADAKRDGIQNYANVQAEAVANIVLSDVNRDQLLALAEADTGIGMEFRGNRGSSEILAGNGYEIDALRAGIGLQIEAWKLEAAAKQLKFEDVLPDKLSLLAIAGLAFPPTALPSSLYLAAEGLDTALKIAKQSVGNAVLDDLLDVYALKVNDAQKAKLAAVAQPGWADGIAAVVDDPSPAVTGATIISQSNSDPELAAVLPPLPDRKPDIFDAPIPPRKPESPSSGDTETNGASGETDPIGQDNPSAEDAISTNGPEPLTVVVSSVGDVAVVRVNGPDLNGDGRPDGFLEHRFADNIQTTTLNYVADGKLYQELQNVTVFGEDLSLNKYGVGLTDILDRVTPDLRSSVSQLAVQVFSDTVFQNFAQAKQLAAKSSIFSEEMTFADILKLAASDKVTYVDGPIAVNQSLRDEFFTNGVNRVANFTANWLTKEATEALDLDTRKFADQMIATLINQTAKSGAIWVGSVVDNGIRQTGQIKLPDADSILKGVGGSLASAAVSFAFDKVFGDIGVQPETEEGAIAIGISQTLLSLTPAVSGLASSIGTALGLAGWSVPIIGPIIGFAAGKIIITPIANIFFGHDDTIALAVIRADLADNRVEVGQVTQDDGGSKKYAAAQAKSVTDLINAIIELGDATITKYSAYKIGHTDEIPIGGPSSNGEKWHFKSQAHAVDVVASKMLSSLGLKFQDADYQRLYEELPKNSKFAANLLEAFGKLSVFNAVEENIDVYRALLELDPENEDLAAAIQTHDGALAEGLVQEVVMDEHPDGTSGPITGGGNSDLLLGAKDQPSLVRGNKGDDTIVSGGGEDTLDGGTGDDTFYALAGDKVIPGAGDDIVFLVDGYATVLPSDGDDIVLLPSIMEETSIINFDGGLTQIQVPGRDAFWLSDIEAIGFADGEVLRLPDPKSQVTYLNTDDAIGTNDFVVEFNLTLTDENLTADLISFSHDGQNVLKIGIFEGRGFQFKLLTDETKFGYTWFSGISVGQEYNIRLAAYHPENSWSTVSGHFRLFVDDELISESSILERFPNGVVDRGASHDLEKVDRVDVASSYAITDDGTVGPSGAFVSDVSLSKLGFNGPSSPVVFGEDVPSVSGPLFWVDKSGKRTEIFDGTSADLSIGKLEIDDGRFELTPTDLDVLEEGQTFSETVTLKASNGETVDLQFEVIGAAEPEPQPTPEYPDTLISDEVETPVQPMLEVVRIAGNQNMREMSGNIPAELVPSAEDERVLVTKYGTLVIEPSGRWTWTSDRDALRSLDQGEFFDETFVVGDLEFQFQIAGLEDRARAEGSIYTTLILSESDELTGAISVNDPDLSDNPTFAGTRASGEYGTAIVSEDGLSYTYSIDDFSVPPPDGISFTERLTFLADDGETSLQVKINLWARGDKLEEHWGLQAEPDPQPTPEYPYTLIPDEVETPLKPMLEVVRIAGNQNMRETSGNIPAEFVPSAADQRVLVTEYGTLVIELSGRWTWTSDPQALRSLGQDEAFSSSHILGGVEVQFDIVGLDDRPMTGGTSSTTLIVNDTDELTGSISIVDPDLSDNPSFAGARAEGQYGTAIVADDGNTFTYRIDFSVPAPVGNVFPEKLTFLASDGETSKTVQINLWSRGRTLEAHWGNGKEPEPQPTPEYPDFLVTDEVEPPARPELEVVRITGTQWLREASGRIDPSLVPSVAEDRVLVTDYGRLEIASNGPWQWTSDFDALRALDQGEFLNEAFVVGGVEFRFEIAGLEDRAQAGGVIYTHLRIDDASSVSGEINIHDPDDSDHPSFAGTLAEGEFGTAVVSNNGDLFTYTVDHSLGPPPGNHFTETLVFLADDGETTHRVTVNLYARDGDISDHWSNDEPAPLIGVDASDTGLF